MNLKYTIIGFIIALGIGFLFGNLAFISNPADYCGVGPQNFPCNHDVIVSIANWMYIHPFAFGGNRILIWIISAVLPLIGLLVDIKTKNDTDQTSAV